MELKQYQYVLKVAELKSITKAAEELYITQPSLSHYIAKIEEELGALIFNRGTTPISLTPAGEVYIETAKMILGLDCRMKENIRDIVDSRKGVITIGMSHARAAYFLPYVFPEFKKVYPGVDIKTLETKSSMVEEEVLKGRCDMGIVPLPCTRDGLQSQVVFKEELLLVSGRLMGAESGESGRPYVNVRRIRNEPFVLLKKGHGIRTAVDVLFMEQGSGLQNIFETTSNETAFRIATTGMALSIVPQTTIALSSYVKKPYVYSLSKEGVFWEIAVIYRDAQLLTQAQKAFIGMLKECFLSSGTPE